MDCQRAAKGCSVVRSEQVGSFRSDHLQHSGHPKLLQHLRFQQSPSSPHLTMARRAELSWRFVILVVSVHASALAVFTCFDWLACAADVADSGAAAVGPAAHEGTAVVAKHASRVRHRIVLQIIHALLW